MAGIAAAAIILALNPPLRASADAQAPTGGLPPAVSGPVRVGGDIKPPVKIKDAKPVYPPEAQAARIQGVVMIEAIIGVDGRVTGTRLIRSVPQLDAAALDAVRQWEYTPTTLAGKPVEVIMTVTVNFSMDLPAPPSAAPPLDLTGDWIGDDGGIYHIRTVGPEIFWFGRNEFGSWANVFHGTLSGLAAYTGRWADVPPGLSRNVGVITIRVLDANQLEMAGDPSNFTGRRWRRRGSAPATAAPQGAAGRGAAAAAAIPIPAGQFGAGAYRPGPGIAPPKTMRNVNPKYTQEAMKAKIEGTVQLEAVVREDGTAGDIRVVRSLDSTFGLDEAAMQALREWQFSPGRDRDGRPVPVLVMVEMSFRLH
jgi:TonB family protein